MYAGLFLGKCKPEARNEMLKRAEEYPERMKDYKGFKGIILFSNIDENDVGNITLWEEQEDFNNYIASLSSEYVENTNSMFIEPPLVNTYYINNYSKTIKF